MNNQGKTKRIYLIISTALCAAIITVMTAVVKINLSANGEYIHLGDSMVYLSACILPMPYSLIAAALGGGLADILAGAAVWAPFTAIIKALNVLPFALMYSLKITKNPDRLLNKAVAPIPVLSGIITVIGYLAAGSLLYSFAYSITSIPLNTIQTVGNAIVYYLAAAALDKIEFKKRIFQR